MNRRFKCVNVIARVPGHVCVGFPKWQSGRSPVSSTLQGCVQLGQLSLRWKVRLLRATEVTLNGMSRSSDLMFGVSREVERRVCEVELCSFCWRGDKN